MARSVLHVSTFDNLGGSARSAYYIHSGLRAAGLRSRMLVRDKHSSDDDVDHIARGAWNMADRVMGRGLDKAGLHYVLYPSSFRLLTHPWYREADVVQLYNTHSGYFSHSVLPRMSAKKPVVWRLSDMWPMTGHCAFSGPCEKWRNGCRGCPDLATQPAIPRDTAGMLFRWKDSVYSRSRIHVVAPNRWIKAAAEESPLLGRFPTTLIYNGVDTKAFRPLEKSLCRGLLGLPQDKNIALFLAHSVEDAKKGGVHFLAAMNALWEGGRRDIMAMAVGERSSGWASRLACPLWTRDFVKEDDLLALIYGAADVYVHAAVRENFPNAILEALACGAPVIAFDTGGVREVIDPPATGYLAENANARELAEGLGALLSSPSERERLARAGLDAVRRGFSLERQTGDFLRLYDAMDSRDSARPR